MEPHSVILSRNRFFLAAALLLALHALLLVTSSWNKSPTYDEPEHLKFGLVYLEGLDLSRYISTHPQVIRGHKYLLGRLNDDGWWYYYVVVALLVFFSLFSSVQLGIRYLPPALPLLFIWIDGLLESSSRCPAPPARPLKVAVAILLAALAISSLAAFPDYISYTGELAGPRIHACRLMADSNLEWGQDRWYLQQYLRQHPGVSPLSVDCVQQNGQAR